MSENAPSYEQYRNQCVEASVVEYESKIIDVEDLKQENANVLKSFLEKR